MMGSDMTIWATVVAVVAAFLAAFFKRGQQVKQLKNQIESKEEVDEIVQSMGDAVPQSFHIDRLLANKAGGAKPSASANSGKGGLR